MPTRQPGRRAIIVASIMGLCIILIWAATFRAIYLHTYPLATWEQSTCRDTISDASNTPPSDEVLVGIQASVPPGFRGAGIPTRAVVCALRISDGALVHRYLLPGRVASARPVNPSVGTLRQSGNTLYVYTYDGQLCAFHATGGEPLWCHTTQPYGGSAELIVADGVVFSKAGPRFNVLDAYDGALLWQENLNDNTYSPSQQTQTFVVSGAKVYIGKNNLVPDNLAKSTFSICARAARTGSPDWCQPLGTGMRSLARVELGGDTIFAFVKDTSPSPPVLYALRATDGNILWQRQFSCPGIWPPVMAYAPDVNASGRGVLLFGEPPCDGNASKLPDTPSKLLALRADDGTPLWTVTPGALAGIAVADGNVYLDIPEIANGESVVRATTIQALRVADASPVWRFRMPALTTRLVLTGDTLVALAGPFSLAPASPVQSLYALRRASGAELWQSTGCNANLDPYFWHDRILRHEQSAPVWCHWLMANPYSVLLNPVLQ